MSKLPPTMGSLTPANTNANDALQKGKMHGAKDTRARSTELVAFASPSGNRYLTPIRAPWLPIFWFKRDLIIVNIYSALCIFHESYSLK